MTISKITTLLFSIILFTVGCNSPTYANDDVLVIAEDPDEAFSELMKLQKYNDFLLAGNHPEIATFNAATKEKELELFTQEFNPNSVPADGYLNKAAAAAEELGILRIFHDSNLKKKKTPPPLRMSDGFRYSWLVLSVHKTAYFYFYKITRLLEAKQENKAIDLLRDYVNAELLTSSPSTKTLKFIDLLNKKYPFSPRNAEQLAIMRKKLNDNIQTIMENSRQIK